MFELQRSINPHYIHFYDDAETYLKSYPWMSDFCTYINLDRPLVELEWYYVHSEVAWMRRLSKWEMADIDVPKEFYDQIGRCSLDDLVPKSLKYELFNLFCHFGGDGYPDMMNNFYKWYDEHYKVDMPLYKMRRGKVLLDLYRLKTAEFMGDVNHKNTSPEESYALTIASAVDNLVGFDVPIPEETMIEALEYAEQNNLKIDIVQDVRPNESGFNIPVHIEYIGSCGETAALS